MKNKAFTLAEVLITLAIIGVVAAISIPSVISNAQQQEFKTGLRKAVSVLNSAITMNIALDGETPYDNGDLFRYFQKHMSIMKSTTRLPWGHSILFSNGGSYRWSVNPSNSQYGNAAFYTTDGFRYEFHWNEGYITRTTSYVHSKASSLHETSSVKPHIFTALKDPTEPFSYMGCGSYGLASNPNNTTKPPCIIWVDVNGDKKPYPSNPEGALANDNIIKIIDPKSKKVSDTFTILITEDRAIPYGVVAQKAMYQAQK